MMSEKVTNFVPAIIKNNNGENIRPYIYFSYQNTTTRHLGMSRVAAEVHDAENEHRHKRAKIKIN